MIDFDCYPSEYLIFNDMPKSIIMKQFLLLLNSSIECHDNSWKIMNFWLSFAASLAASKVPHTVEGVLDFQAVRLAYCYQAAGLKKGKPWQETSMCFCVVDNSDEFLC